MLREVSVVMCTRDCLNLVEANLSMLREELREAEMIIIDGNSTDGTKEFVVPFADKMLSDGGKGLAYARQLGAVEANRPYVLYAGSDNRISRKTVEIMAQALHSNPKLAAVGAQTIFINAHSYWAKVMALFFKYLINHPGPRDVVGTPSMYRRAALMQIQFDAAIKACDDTELGERLIKAGYTLEVVDAFAEENNPLDYKEFVHRWNGYGRSDAEFYATQYKQWSFWRKVKSYTHPLRKFGFKGAGLFLIHGNIIYIPGLWWATFLRYRGWYRSARKGYFGR